MTVNRHFIDKRHHPRYYHCFLSGIIVVKIISHKKIKTLVYNLGDTTVSISIDRDLFRTGKNLKGLETTSTLVKKIS